MRSVADVRDRLPSLYRPDRGDRGLVTTLLRAAVGALDEVDRDAGDVMHAHWYRYADSALFSRFFLQQRLDAELLPADPADAEDAAALALFHYVNDLARLAALLPLPPWQELLPPSGSQPAQREPAEAYRARIGRVVRLYRNGLGTLPALRTIAEVQLPVEPGAPEGQRDRGFSLEEHAPLETSAVDVRVRGVPDELVGPLMRFTLENAAVAPSPPTILVEGLNPVEGEIDATERPLLELFDAGGDRVRVALGFRKVVPPGRTLRLRPATSSWLGLEGGLARARSGPGGDPTAPGPWEPAEEAPDGVVAVLQTRDRAVWAANETGLFRYDGQAWSEAVGDLPTVRSLAEDGDDLLVGTDDGLLRVAQHEPEARAVEGVADAVGALLRDGPAWWIGTSTGLLRLEGGGATPFGLTGTPVLALARDRGGVVYAGTELGLFQLQPRPGHWYWYAGGEASDQVPDWRRFHPEEEDEPARSFPSEEDVFLPAVRCVHRGPDASLWLGTEAGLARYVARAVEESGAARGLAYTTVLEAFPELGAGPVHAIAEDERGLVWFATDRGLLRYDGRDLWQLRSEGWTQLGAAGSRGSWRFSRSSGRWQRLQAGPPLAWVPFAGEPRTTDEPAVRCIAWSDEAVADLLGDGDPEPVDPEDLVVRYKPSDTAIVTGGVPALPRLPEGTSTWRYLSLEPEGVSEPDRRPAWTVEGRLLPPPPDRAAAVPGRYDLPPPPEESLFDDAVYAFRPAARVRFEWRARRPLSVLARLQTRSDGEHIEPAVLDRVFQGLEGVRPAGVNTMLAVDEDIVRGGADGSAG